MISVSVLAQSSVDSPYDSWDRLQSSYVPELDEWLKEKMDGYGSQHL